MICCRGCGILWSGRRFYASQERSDHIRNLITVVDVGCEVPYRLHKEIKQFLPLYGLRCPVDKRAFLLCEFTIRRIFSRG